MIDLSPCVRIEAPQWRTAELEATHLRGNRYCVRPKGRLGTCGFYPFAWNAVFVTARNADSAIAKARLKIKAI